MNFKSIFLILMFGLLIGCNQTFHKNERIKYEQEYIKYAKTNRDFIIWDKQHITSVALIERIELNYALGTLDSYVALDKWKKAIDDNKPIINIRKKRNVATDVVTKYRLMMKSYISLY